MILYGFVTLVSLLLWSRDRKVGLFLWLAIFTATPAILLMLQEFLISHLLRLGQRAESADLRAESHLSLVPVALPAAARRQSDTGPLDRGSWRSAHSPPAFLMEASRFSGAVPAPGCRCADAVLTTIILLVEVFPFVIVAIGIRQRLDHAHWVVAISALVSQMIDTIADAERGGTAIHPLDSVRNGHESALFDSRRDLQGRSN